MTDCRRITVNADASDGTVRAELLTAEGNRVRGFTKDDCQPMTGDSLRHEVQWASALADLPAEAYHLRLHLDHATVYAVTFE